MDMANNQSLDVGNKCISVMDLNLMSVYVYTQFSLSNVPRVIHFVTEKHI